MILFPLTLLLFFRGQGAGVAVTPFGDIGLEYTAPKHLMHWTAIAMLLHWTAPKSTLHYTAEENDS